MSVEPNRPLTKTEKNRLKRRKQKEKRRAAAAAAARQEQVDTRVVLWRGWGTRVMYK